MKKLYLSIIMLLSFSALIAQNVPRQMVAVEDGTGTWCTYCPGAAMGCDDLLSHGCFVAVVANHNGDSFTNNYSNARNSMWNITGFPSVSFDGTLGVVGGNHTTSLYTSYLPKYNQCIAASSPVAMSWTISNTGLDYTVVITLNKVGTITSTNNVLYFFVTQSNIQYNWQGQNHLEHVNRLMSPDQNGTAIDFSTGNTQVVTLNFSMDAAWPLADCEFIAMLQDKDAGQGNIPGGGSNPIKKWVVYQCIKRAVIDLFVDFTASQTTIPKDGSVTFTNNTSGGYIGTNETYQWSFPGGTPDASTDKNPTVVYSECGAHDVMLIVNRGGQIDTVNKPLYILVGTIVNVLAIPNDTVPDNQSITLDATTPGATYLWAPGGETTPTITIDGSVVGAGAHLYAVTVNTPDGCSQYIISRIFFTPYTGITQNKNDLTTILYPNPNQGSFTLEMNSLTPQNISIEISNAMGIKVYSENGITFSGKLVKPINLNNVPAGVYFLSIRNSGKNIVQKFLVK
ncbi:MAG: T9SS C-terminal target domain-containing protein [Bacteroidetes bacterium]|nr:MAG: T9SS C-terminal target domain-containing protein [Bacteroidota bacterium]